jgi:D-3-phosphoglycerate dehydrogenase / 2-oxoglutarate reductase
MKILLATQKPFAAGAVQGIREIIEGAGYEFATLEKYASEDDLALAAADVGGLIVRSDLVGRTTFEAAKGLKIVVRAGAGYDNIDLQQATEHGVTVMNTPGQNANAVAELFIALMIFMARNQFTPSTGCEIMGKTLGIQGFGNVGALIAKKAVVLGMRVLAYDPVRSAEDLARSGVEPVGMLEELYSQCDCVSVNVPLPPSTKGIIGRELLCSMPKGAVLINTARKEVVDEQGLLEALEAREDLRYATDVAPDNYEELRGKFGLRVYANPKKMGAQTAEANVNAGLAAARQTVDFLRNGNAKFQVNR